MKQIYSILIVFFLSTAILSAQEGSLDATFNTTGKVVTQFSGLSAYIYGTAVQGDGKIVAVGYTTNGGANQFAVVRYSSNGALDNTFGSGGKVTTDVGGNSDSHATSVVIQPDGKIVVGGGCYADDMEKFAVVRYNSDGTLDGGFGTGGIVITAIGSIGDRITSLALQSDGKIVAGGYSDVGSFVYQFALVRYSANGTLDTGFDTDGVVTTDIRSGKDKLYAIVIQSDGMIVAGGYSESGPGDYDYALVRCTSNGTLDTGFDTDGIVITPVGLYSSTVTSLAIQSDGKIVAGGYAQPASSYNFALVRYNTNGSLDTGFDTDGKVIVIVGSGENEINSISLQSDGKIVAAGNDAAGFAVARFNTNGSLDNSFDSDGKVTTLIGANSSIARCVVIQSDGKIIAAGSSTENGSDHDFAVARYSGAVPSIGSALRLDGTNDYVSVPSGVYFNGGNFTVEGWVYEYQYNYWSRLIDFANGSGDNNVIIALSTNTSGKVSFHIFQDASSENIEAPAPLLLNQWNHIACVWNAGTATIYINGSAVVSGPVHAPNNVTRTSNYIGKSNWDDDFAYAKLDEIRIWNIALDSTTIQQNMHRTIDPGTSDLAAYWQFNSNSGAIAAESHGKSGVLNNFNFTGTSGWVPSTIPAAPGTSTTSSAFTSVTASMGDVSLTTTDAFDNAVDLTATKLSAIPNIVPGSYASVIGDKYYVVNVFGEPGTYSANLTINFGASTLDTRVDTNPGGVRLYRRSSISDASWTLVGGAASANSTTGNVTWNGLTTLGQFAAVYEESALPVELVSFTASAQKEGIELQWNTATEVNNHGFEVERRSVSRFTVQGSSTTTTNLKPETSNSSWTRVTFVEGSGNSNTAHEYSYTDRSLSAGTYSFRLKQIDRDGKFEYSPEVEVTVGGVPAVFALEQNYPNPFNPTTTIGFMLQISGKTTLKIYDVIGREVATLVNENLEAGVYHQRMFDASHLSSGIFFARLTSNNASLVRRIVLMK